MTQQNDGRQAREISIRMWLAGMAMSGLQTVKYQGWYKPATWEQIADDVVALADATLARLRATAPSGDPYWQALRDVRDMLHEPEVCTWRDIYDRVQAMMKAAEKGESNE